MLQGSARVFIRNLHATALAGELIDFIEVEGVKVLDICMIRNKITGKFTGLLKATILGNNVMNKWTNEGKANLGGLRRPIEIGKPKSATIAPDLDI